MADSDVTDLISTRLYPLVVPQDATLPAVAYQRISGPRDLTHSGPSELARARIQLTFLGSTYSEAKSVAEAVRGSLNGERRALGGVAVGEVSLANEIDDWAMAFDKPVVRQDYTIWYKES